MSVRPLMKDSEHDILLILMALFHRIPSVRLCEWKHVTLPQVHFVREKMTSKEEILDI